MRTLLSKCGWQAFDVSGASLRLDFFLGLRATSCVGDLAVSLELSGCKRPYMPQQSMIPLNFVMVLMRAMERLHRPVIRNHVGCMHTRRLIGVNSHGLFSQVFQIPWTNFPFELERHRYVAAEKRAASPFR